MPSVSITRIAPTPSGFIHEGNAYNFLLNWLMARYYGWTLRLRIDDLDRARFRPEYLEDIFRSLEWLRIDYDLGPEGPEAHLKHHSQALFLDRYQSFFNRLREKNLLFPCSCSRSDLNEFSSYPGTCLKAPAGSPPYAWRLLPVSDKPITLHGLTDSTHMHLPPSMEHTVLWRKDAIPAYQLASLSDDLEYGITHIVRGKDLLDSSLFQIWLSQVADEKGFASVKFLHHKLLNESSGEKLSKSRGHHALFQIREKEKDPHALYNRFLNWLESQPSLDPGGQLKHYFLENRSIR